MSPHFITYVDGLEFNTYAPSETSNFVIYWDFALNIVGWADKRSDEILDLEEYYPVEDDKFLVNSFLCGLYIA